MTRILKFNEHQNWNNIAENFIQEILNPKLLESSESKEEIMTILKDLQRDLKFNVQLIFTFGTGIASMYPIVLNLIKNQNLKVELTTENIVLLTLTTLVILGLETKKDLDLSKDDAKTLLMECKLRGVGNGIVKKMVNCFKSLGNLVKIIFDKTPKVFTNILDMFAYTSLLIPTMNALNSLISDYNWNMDTIIGNLASLGIGILTFLSKNGLNYLIRHLGKKAEINPELSKIANDSADLPKGEIKGNKLITEQ